MDLKSDGLGKFDSYPTRRCDFRLKRPGKQRDGGKMGRSDFA
ncbi:hypothetical protein RSSM_01907 [Rhodopirellula sallentina SM41]|uniref:Uncharacterized protein n=1 Tax=Rhodopirellula sallentina SM41 TaxID=1263870 RepID=M5UKW1_9BACT|nr:hypothetical protein RSSM_01907 [Rhodopirellula sallentina SM41]